jgi:hypothetical protein
VFSHTINSERTDKAWVEAETYGKLPAYQAKVSGLKRAKTVGVLSTAGGGKFKVEIRSGLGR